MKCKGCGVVVECVSARLKGGYIIKRWFTLKGNLHDPMACEHRKKTNDADAAQPHPHQPPPTPRRE